MGEAEDPQRLEGPGPSWEEGWASRALLFSSLLQVALPRRRPVAVCFYDPALLCNGNSRFQSAGAARLSRPPPGGLRGVTMACEQTVQLGARNGVAARTLCPPGGLPPRVGGNSEVGRGLAKQNPEPLSFLSSGFSC